MPAGAGAANRSSLAPWCPPVSTDRLIFPPHVTVDALQAVGQQAQLQAVGQQAHVGSPLLELGDPRLPDPLLLHRRALGIRCSLREPRLLLLPEEIDQAGMDQARLSESGRLSRLELCARRLRQRARNRGEFRLDQASERRGVPFTALAGSPPAPPPRL